MKERQKTTCKHYTGTYHNTHCAAGVCYRDVTTEPDRHQGSGLRIPCHNEPFPNSTPSQLEEFNKRGKCDKFELPTDAEIAEEEAFFAKRMEMFATALPLIEKVKAEHEGKDWKGIEKCPFCGGKLHITHSRYNGHVWGKCETENCLAWME